MFTSRLACAAAVCALSSLLIMPGRAQAQEAPLAELYGLGVHAYFASQYDQAHESLTQAIEQGARDPRCFYFRGLVNLKLGRPDEAAGDFQQGAQLEAEGAGRLIGRSLERVQGYERMQLEQHRQQARFELRRRAEDRQSQRAAGTARTGGGGLPGDILPAGGAAPSVPPPLPDQAPDPFRGDQAGAIGTGVAPQPRAEIEAAAGGDEADPFDATPTPPAGDEADPFGGAAPAPPADEADPLGATPTPPAGDAADPFGGAAPAPPADEADPFGATPAPPAGGGDDPFGAPPAAAGPQAGPPAAGGTGKGSALGSVFGALGRAVAGSGDEGGQPDAGAAPGLPIAPADPPMVEKAGPGDQAVAPPKEDADAAQDEATDPFADDPFK